MPLYESTFIARHEMSTQQVEGLAASFTNIIEENGGKVHKTEHWGLRNLAYRINKNRKGHFVFFNIDAASEAVQEYERNLRLNEDILRYLTVRVEELDPEPSPMMQTRSPRDDRARRGGPYAGKPRSQPAESAPVAGSAPVVAEADGKEAASAKPAPAAKEKIPAAKPAAETVPSGAAEEVKAEPKTEAKTTAKAAASDSDESAVAEPEKKSTAKTAAKKKTETAEAEPEAEPEKKTKSQATAKEKKSQATAKEKTEAKTETAVKDKAKPKTAKAKTVKAKAKATKKSKSDAGDET